MSTYGSPSAFRRALTDKLNVLAKSGKWSLTQLQRQFAYDRLLERLYVVDDGWIMKGATALIARDLGVRGTIDVDLYRNVEIKTADEDVRRAASLDLGDWFRFEIGATQELSEGTKGIRFPVTALVGLTTWSQFHIDFVGSSLRMIGTPDDVPALARVLMPDVEQRGYRVYPLVDHIADKLAAISERYRTYPSTRFKDLVDLVAIVTQVTVDADLQRLALVSEFDRRGLDMPTQFEVPDRNIWSSGYSSLARESLLSVAPTLDDAVAIVEPFVNPLFAGTARGAWNPLLRCWDP